MAFYLPRNDFFFNKCRISQTGVMSITDRVYFRSEKLGYSMESPELNKIPAEETAELPPGRLAIYLKSYLFKISRAAATTCSTVRPNFSYRTL
jgi:hypothetical protein